MKLKVLYTVVLILLATSAFAQNGWNWPEDPAEKKEVQSTYTLYNDSYRAGNFEEAKVPLEKLLTEYPKLNESIYINGRTIHKEAWKNEKDAAKKAAAAEKVMGIWEARFSNYSGAESKNIDRMAIDAFSMMYKDASKTQYLLDLFEKTISVRGDKTNYAVLKYDMTAAKLAISRNLDMSSEKILEIYNRNMTILDAQITSLSGQNKSTAKQESTKEDIDKILAELGVIDCNFIVEKLVPEFRDNPDDAELAKKIFSFAFEGGCTDADWFADAAIKMFENEPNYGVAYLLATRFLKEKDYLKSKEYFLKAVELTDDNTDQAKALKQIASSARSQNDKPQAREYALKTIEAEPSTAPDMYTMIGELYLGSSECDKKVSKIDDRARFIAAYDMFVKAGNRSRMKVARENFPAFSDIFSANREEGEKVTIGCWIQTTVSLQRRPEN
jgi:tetratricopeptide (TPR) repeat protein